MDTSNSDTNEAERANAAPSTARREAVLWGGGLLVSVLALLGGSLGAAGMPARILGLFGLALGVGAAVVALKASRQRPWGAGLAIAAGLFAAIVGGHPKEPRTILLADAPRYKARESQASEGEMNAAVRSAPTSVELMFHPGPLGLSFSDFLPLAGRFVPSGLVAAEWDGGWFAGRILSVNGNAARVHFIGWESEWDEDVPRAGLRGLTDAQVPVQVPAARTLALGTTTPQACAFTVGVYQPADGVGAGVNVSALSPTSTLYAERFDLADAAIDAALPGVASSKPFALRIAGALRFDADAPYFFGLTSDGTSTLSIDGQAVSPGKPVTLESGVHRVRLDYRHDAGAKMTLGLRSGTDPKVLRVVDTERQGVAQVLHDADGSLRLVLFEGILFDLDRDELKPSAEQALSTISSTTLVPVPAARVRVEGHTDDQGSDEHNLDLSRRRAERVKAWLATHGRDEGTLSTEGLGEKRPRLPNDSADHRRRNRRVELVIASNRAVAPSAPVAPAPASATGGAANAAVIELLHAYYGDLNGGKFEATRYFEPNVERYISMLNTNVGAMNHYIRDVFPKQFKEPRFELEEGSLAQESPGQYVYIEKSHYIVAGKSVPSDKRVRVRIRLSPGGKIVFLHQFQVVR